MIGALPAQPCSNGEDARIFFDINQQGTIIMNSMKTVGILLIVAGLLGAALGGFSFTKDRQEARLGPIQLSVAEEQTVNIPLWASLGVIAVGAAVMVLAAKR
jgi:uncharacterized membrane protein YidH (DUF202 family)